VLVGRSGAGGWAGPTLCIHEPEWTICAVVAAVLPHSLLVLSKGELPSGRRALCPVPVCRSIISAYKTKAYYAPALLFNPRVGLSDYDEVNWATESCSLQMNGFKANGCLHTSCSSCTVGNTMSPSMYGP
jgi:hypothetical protein